MSFRDLDQRLLDISHRPFTFIHANARWTDSSDPGVLKALTKQIFHKRKEKIRKENKAVGRYENWERGEGGEGLNGFYQLKNSKKDVNFGVKSIKHV